MQNSRALDMPRLVATRIEWKPIGASLGTSSFTFSDVGVLLLLASVGMVTLAGNDVHTPVGSCRLVPVSVRSMLVPRCAPVLEIAARVGAWGLTGAGGGCATSSAVKASRKRTI